LIKSIVPDFSNSGLVLLSPNHDHSSEIHYNIVSRSQGALLKTGAFGLLFLRVENSAIISSTRIWFHSNDFKKWLELSCSTHPGAKFNKQSIKESFTEEVVIKELILTKVAQQSTLQVQANRYGRLLMPAVSRKTVYSGRSA
jgi:hypothetical protein